MRVDGGAEHGVLRRQAAAPFLVVIGDHQDAVHDGHAEERDEADGGGDAEIQAGDVERQYAAHDGERECRPAPAGNRAALLNRL